MERKKQNKSSDFTLRSQNQTNKQKKKKQKEKKHTSEVLKEKGDEIRIIHHVYIYTIS